MTVFILMIGDVSMTLLLVFRFFLFFLDGFLAKLYFSVSELYLAARRFSYIERVGQQKA